MAASIIPPEAEHLTTGWEPDLSAEDTLVRQAVLVYASWPVEIARGAGRPWRAPSARSGWASGWIGDRGALTKLGDPDPAAHQPLGRARGGWLAVSPARAVHTDQPLADSQPVAVAVAHLHAGVTLVEYVAALPAARGRGAGAAVTWAATLAEPDRPAVLLASDDGRPLYERMGYLAVERWSAWLRPGR